MKRKKNKQFYFEFSFLGLIVISLIYKVTIDAFGFYIPEFLLIKCNNIEDLMNTLFTVQASISTIGIAIIALVSDKTKDTIYGLTISKFVMEDKPYFFKHKYLIIASLLTTVFNFISIAAHYYNVSIELFIVNVFIMIKMTLDIFQTFLGEKQIKQEIQTYILQSYNENLLHDFNSDLELAIFNNNTLKLTEDFNFILLLFENEIRNTTGHKMLPVLENIFYSAFTKIINSNNIYHITLCLNILKAIYDYANGTCQEEKRYKVFTSIPLSIWDKDSKLFYRAISKLSYDTLNDTLIIYNMHRALYDNITYKKVNDNLHPINCYDLDYFSSRIYFALFKNNNCEFNIHQQENIKVELFESIYIIIQYDINKNKTAFRELLNYTKLLIDNCDYLAIKKTFIKYLDYEPTSEVYNKYIFRIIIYLYYLSYREPLVEKTQVNEFARKLIADYNNSIYEFIYQYEFEEDPCIVYNDIIMWERMSEDAMKYMAMERVIQDFYIFYILENECNEEQLYLRLSPLVEKYPYKYYSCYYEEEEVKVIEKLYQQFVNAFFYKKIDNLEAKEKIEILKLILLRIYKEAEIKKSQIISNKYHNFKSYELSVENLFLDQIKDISYVLKYAKDLNTEKLVTQNMTILNYRIPIEFIDEIISGNHFKITVINSIVDLIKKLLYKSIVCEDVKLRSHDKLNQFLNIIKSNNINSTVVFGKTKYSKIEQEYDKYLEFIKAKTIILAENRRSYLIGIDTHKVYINIDKVNVTISNYDVQQIFNFCKEVDGKYMIKINNNIYVPFEKEELIDYINNTTKNLQVSVKVSYCIHDDIVGAGINIIQN